MLDVFHSRLPPHRLFSGLYVLLLRHQILLTLSNEVLRTEFGMSSYGHRLKFLVRGRRLHVRL